MNEYGARTGALSEDMEPEGRLTNYAKAKREVAAIGFEAAKKFGKTFLHARTFYVYGAGQRPGSLINDLYQASLTGAEVNLSPCEHYRDYIHVSEVAEGLRRLSVLRDSATVNLGSGTVIQVRDFVLLLWKALGGDIRKAKFGARKVGWDEPEQPRSYADLTRLSQLTNWTPSLSLEQGVIRTVEDLRRAANLRQESPA
jgi:nucleoside-diphosphate-sugar epimerase